MKKFILLLFFLLYFDRSFSQSIVKDTLHPSFEWKYHLLDFPFMINAAKTENIRLKGLAPSQDVTPTIQDYVKTYRNLSMLQVTDMARNLHGTFYYGHNLLWSKLVKPENTKKYILNRILANITALATDYLIIKLPYGYAFQHEEFHRAVMTSRCIYSFDEVWKFGKGLDIAVTSVKDEDLIYLKKNYPADQVRLSAAGVEGEYAYISRMREDNFFKQTGYPFLGISILGTFHAVSYVNLPFDKRFNAITDSILSHDKDNILARDFTGYDFSAWVFDLFTPDEPYSNRGTWPSGIGIKRPVKESDLSPEMKHFLKETGSIQYINFISPFMLGINKFQFKPGYYFNFALRSLPTSFGYYAGGDFFLDFNEKQIKLELGINRSKNLVLPSFGINYYNIFIKKNPRFKTNIHFLGWLQPKNQMFAADQADPGFQIGVYPQIDITKRFSMIADLSYKSKGWVFANPFLDEKFMFRLGFSLKTL